MSIHSDGENDFVHLLTDGQETYTGGKTTGGGAGDWSDGSAWNYTNWKAGEPNGNPGECVELNRWPDNEWNDINCGNQRSAICQLYANP